MSVRILSAISILCAGAVMPNCASGSDVPVPITSITNFTDPFLPTLPTGNTTFGGVAFELPAAHEIWVGNLNNNAPDLVASLSLSQPSVGAAYFLLMTGNTLAAEMSSGDRIGSIVVSYSSGGDLVVPLLVGVNVREWAIGGNAATHITTFTSPNLQQVWSGIDTRGITSVVDMLTVPIDSSRTVTGISLRDESLASIGRVNPVLAVRGITLQTVPEPTTFALLVVSQAVLLLLQRARTAA